MYDFKRISAYELANLTAAGQIVENELTDEDNRYFEFLRKFFGTHVMYLNMNCGPPRISRLRGGPVRTE